MAKTKIEQAVIYHGASTDTLAAMQSLGGVDRVELVQYAEGLPWLPALTAETEAIIAQAVRHA
jgi:hypothetical protein